MTLDLQIRNLLRDGLGPELAPPSVADVERRARRSPARDTRPRRAMLLAACVAALALLGAGLLALRADHATGPAGAPTDASDGSGAVPGGARGAEVGRYFLPAELPDGFTLLGISESAAAEPIGTARGRAVYEQVSTGARVTLSLGDPAGRWTSSARTTEVPNGSVRWTPMPVDGSTPFVPFQAELGTVVIDGEARGLTEAELPQLFATIGTTTDGSLPSIDDPSFELRTGSPGGAGMRATAQWSASYGPPGGYFGMAGITVDVVRYAGPVDRELQAGVWTTTQIIDGRTIHLGMFDSHPWWTPSPDTVVSVHTAGDTGDLTAAAILAALREVDAATFEAEADDIADAASTLPVSEVLAFPSGATLELLGATHDARGLCLTVEAGRRCDLSLMVDAGYLADGVLGMVSRELLIGGHWYSVGITADASTITPDAETATGDNGTWYLVAHADDALVAVDPVDPARTVQRPTR